jgi:hypothetical protein
MDDPVFHLTYIEHEEEDYVKINDVITMMQRLAIMSDEDIDRALSPLDDENPVIAATNQFGKVAARKITNLVIGALDGKETDFTITKKDRLT